MSRTMGPILAIGAVTLGHRIVLHGSKFDAEEPIGHLVTATALAGVGLYAFEKVWPDAAVALAYLALLTVLTVRMDPGTPSPVESLNAWWKEYSR